MPANRPPLPPIVHADEFTKIVLAGQPPALLPLRLIGSLGLGHCIRVIKSALTCLKMPQSPLAATTFYSALPIKFGPYAVQFAFAAQDPPAPMKIAEATTLGDGLAARLREKPVSHDFQLRFYIAQPPPPTPASRAGRLRPAGPVPSFPWWPRVSAGRRG